MLARMLLLKRHKRINGPVLSRSGTIFYRTPTGRGS